MDRDKLRHPRRRRLHRPLHERPQGQAYPGWDYHFCIGILLYCRELRNAPLSELIFPGADFPAVHMRKMCDIDNIFNNIAGLGLNA